MIDILLATYNGEKYIKEQIDSILFQTYKDFRLIISDDCSNDNTRSILEEYQKKDNRIIVFFQNKNLGSTKNFEFLLNKVESPFFALSDQDDIWDLEKIEKSIEVLEKENTDLVFGDLEIVDENLNTINHSFNRYMDLYKKIKKYNNYESLRLHNYVTGCTVVARKKILNKVLPLPKRKKYVLHDHWIALMASIDGKLSYIEKPYIKYRQHNKNQVGIKKTSYTLNSFKEVRKLFLDVKIELFSTYIENKEKFTQKQNKQNLKALEYFKKLATIKNIYLRGMFIFHKLYKYEKFSYYLANFIILNIPFLGRIIFKFKRRK